MLENLKTFIYVSYFNSVYHLPIASVIVGLPAFNLAMDPTICTWFLFGFSQSGVALCCGWLGMLAYIFYTSVWLSSLHLFIFYLSTPYL